MMIVGMKQKSSTILWMLIDAPTLQILLLITISQGNNLQGAIPATLGNCTKLFVIYLDFNQLSDYIPTGITTLEHLQILRLQHNQLLGFKQPVHFKNTTSLIELSLGSNQFNGSIPSELGQLQGLQMLDLSGNQFSGEIPWDSISNCSYLFHLDLSHNLISGEISSSLGKLQRLQNIYLQSNYLQGTIPNFESPTQRLSWSEVNLSFNRLNGFLQESLAQALSPSLQFLDLSHNNFYGALPSWLGRLSTVQLIDLSTNNFNGAIPESLGNCVGLTHLNLSNNDISGEFPLHLGNLNALEVLDFSNNKLTGVLPLYLGKLHHLQILNVSFNNLSGAIPSSGAFKHLTASCFLGNPGLCGPIIQKRCMQSPKQHHHGHHDKKAVLISIPLVAISTLLVCVALYHCYQSSHSQHLTNHPQLEGLAEERRFTAEQLVAATQGFSENNVLGEGALGVVYKGILSSDGKDEVVAVKKFRDVCSREALLQEVKILSKLRHRNLVRIRGCVLNLDVAALVLDFMPNGSLEQLLLRLDWGMLTKIAIGVAKALSYLHHEYGVPIIHGDVKPSNILLDSDLEAHLADFGLAKLARGGAVSISSNFQGSIGYMAPEYAYATQMTTKVDMYSFGVVVLEMLTGKRATQFHESSFHEWVKTNLHDIGHVLLHPSFMLQAAGSSSEIDQMSSMNIVDRAWPLFKMALACTEDHPSNRPTMQEVLAFLTDRFLASPRFEVLK